MQILHVSEAAGTFHSMRLAGAPPNPWFSWEYVERNSQDIARALEQHASLTFQAVSQRLPSEGPESWSTKWIGPKLVRQRTKRWAGYSEGPHGHRTSSFH
jgi:hypothetical protein